MLLLAALVLTACGGSGDNKSTDPIKSAGVLRVGTEGVYAPYSFHDPSQGGQLAGYDVDVAKAVADKLGVRVEFVETSWDSIFAALEADRFDIVANEVTISDERKAKYDLSTPYSIAQGVIVTRVGRQFHPLARGPQGQEGRGEPDQQLGPDGAGGGRRD